MQRQGFRFVKGSAAVMVLLIGATCWAASGSVPFVCNNIRHNGQQAHHGTKTQFNYTLTGKKFKGTAKALVRNRARVDVKFKDVGSLPGLTIKTSEYKVSQAGAAQFAATGTKP